MRRTFKKVDEERAPYLTVRLGDCLPPEAAALDAGYFDPAALVACAKRGIKPYIATGRDLHYPS